MGFVSERHVTANGLGFCLAEAGDSAAPLVILLHGFPECWASWRFQLPILAESGYHVVAPDLRGYGNSDAPADISAYSQKELTRDVIGLIGATGHKEAVLVGHDWGAALAWQTARCFPDQVTAVAALSIPYGGPSPEPPTQIMSRKFGDYFFYMRYFQTPEAPEQELAADIHDSLRRIFHSWSAEADHASINQPRKDGGFLTNMPLPEKQPHWMRDVDLDFYVERFCHSGFRGPINWYRAMDLYWQQTRDEPEEKWRIKSPALYIVGKQDPVLMMNQRALQRMPDYLDDLRGIHQIGSCGHWTQMEQPAEVNRLLLDFLDSL